MAATQTAEISLPPLQVGIYENDKLIRVVELADPREAFCKAYAKKGRPGEARPLTSESFSQIQQ